MDGRPYGAGGGMSLTVYPVTDPTSRLGKAFFRFPLELYRDTPSWTPQLARDVRRILQKKYLPRRAFRSDAFVVVEGARALARFVMVLPREEREPSAGRNAWLALPEAIDREDVWAALFDHARAWCRENGAARLIGPYDLGGTDRAGLLIEGYEERTAPFHPPYYRGRFESGGFEAFRDFVSLSVDLPTFGGWTATDDVVRAQDRDARMRIEYLSSRGDLRRLEAEISALLDDSYPALRRGSGLRRGAVDHGAVTLLRDQRGRLVGCAVPSFDLSPALRRSSGYVGLRTAIDLYRERRRTGRRIVEGLNVRPGDGIPLLLMGLLRRLSENGAEEVTIGGVPADAASSRIDMIGPAGRIRARYRVYGAAV
ncbi:MAG: hypothetical protein MI724_03540 [Spirochaetales bacterium]|nr:hypothetical protein [Spirochaetales bacterium]